MYGGHYVADRIIQSDIWSRTMYRCVRVMYLDDTIVYSTSETRVSALICCCRESGNSIRSYFVSG